MVWFKNDKDNYLTSVDLVLESELNTNETELYNDFTKILISNAKYKIFICTSNPDTQIHLFEKTVKRCENMKNGDHVTVFIWDDYEKKKNGGIFIAHQITKVYE
jgi:predicted RNA-binding protein (virulence factor B family)